MSVFQVLVFDGAVRPHIVPTQYSQSLVDDMFDRFKANLQSYKDVVVGGEVSFDLGGLLTKIDSWVTVEVDGVKFSTLLRDVFFLQGKLKRLEQRRLSADVVYYKLHTAIHAVMLTPKQRDALLAGWAALDLETLLAQEDAAFERAFPIALATFAAVG